MGRTYLKCIRVGQTPQGESLHLYTSVVDSTPVNYYVTHRRKRLFASALKAAAIRKLDHLAIHGVTVEGPPPEVAEADAERLEESDRPWDELRLHVLVWVLMRSLTRTGRSRKHIDNIKVLLSLPNSVIPTGHDAFANWFRGILDELNDTTRSRRSMIRKLVYLNMTMRQLGYHPIACKRWLALQATSVSMIEHRKRTSADKEPTRNRPPLDLPTIQNWFSACTEVEQSFLILAYLALGSRAGKAERLCLSCFTPDWRVDLERIETKTKTGKRPPAPIALRAIAQFMNDRVFEGLPSCVDRKRFRPTCATMLCLAQVPTLTISERLGHGSMSMIIHHYARQTPQGMHGETIEQYLGIGPLIVGGHRVEENAWDRWVLKTALEQAKRFGVIDEFKLCVVACLGMDDTVLPEAAEF